MVVETDLFLRSSRLHYTPVTRRLPKMGAYVRLVTCTRARSSFQKENRNPIFFSQVRLFPSFTFYHIDFNMLRCTVSTL